MCSTTAIQVANDTLRPSLCMHVSWPARWDASEEEQYLVHTAGLAHDIGRLASATTFCVERRSSTRATGGDPASPDRGIRLGRANPWLRPGRRHHPRAPRALGRLRVPRSADRPRDSPLVTHSRYLRGLRRDDRSHESYRPQTDPQAAFEELRQGGATQFDPDLVEIFIHCAAQEGPAASHHRNADFEAELDFERANECSPSRIAADCPQRGPAGAFRTLCCRPNAASARLTARSSERTAKTLRSHDPNG